ncbi:MAG: tetratricopeptide repeat protein [Candidatus Omnitrophota bacterium]
MIILSILTARIIFFFQFQTSPLSLITPSGTDTAFNHRLATELLHHRHSRDILFVSFYTYFLAFVYRVFGINIEIVRIIQMIIGIISSLLVYGIAGKLFDRKTAGLALFLHGLYSVFIFQEGLLLSTTLGIFLSLCLTFWLLHIEEKPLVLGFYIAGLILGLLSKTLNVSLSLIILLSLWIIICPKSPRIKGQRLLCFFLGLFTILTIFTLPNFSRLKETLPIPIHSGINFYIGNNPEATGTFSPPLNMHSSQLGLLKDSQFIAEKDSGRPLSNKEINRFWFKKGIDFIISHPFDHLKLMFKKFFIFINGYEPQDIENLYFAKKFIPLLRFPLISFYFISPLGILGWLLCLRKPETSIIKLFILAYAVSNILYFVTSRYRLPAVPYLIIFASYSLFWLTKQITDHKFKKIAFGDNFYRRFVGDFRSPSRFDLALAIGGQTTARWLVRSKSGGGLGRIFYTFLCCSKITPALCGLACLFLLTNIKIFKPDFSSDYYNLSVRYIAINNLAQAEFMARQAIKINPHFAEAYFNLGIIAYQRGEKEQAAERFLKSVELKPDYSEAYYNLGFVYEQTGNIKQAIKYYLSTLRINSRDEQAYFRLGCAYLKTGELPLAKQAFSQAVQLNPELDAEVKQILYTADSKESALPDF